MTTRPDRKNLEAAYENAGLPHAIYSVEVTPTQERTTWDARNGAIAHSVIGKLAPFAQAVSVQERVHLARNAVEVALSGQSRLGRHDKAALRILGLVSSYMRRYLPANTTLFLGTELSAGDGRVDLGWSNQEVGVFFDELKTWRHHTTLIDHSASLQIRRYLDAGVAEFGDRFAGVRLLTLGHSGGSLAFTPDGTVKPLADSILSTEYLSTLEGVAS